MQMILFQLPLLTPCISSFKKVICKKHIANLKESWRDAAYTEQRSVNIAEPTLCRFLIGFPVGWHSGNSQVLSLRALIKCGMRDGMAESIIGTVSMRSGSRFLRRFRSHL